MRAAAVALVLAAALAGSLASAEDAPALPRPDVYSLHVVSDVRNRYAKTLVTSRVANTADQAREISFDAVLPENAFISDFVIEMDGKAYKAHVRGKEEAKKEYQQAVDSGSGGAHVQLSARDSNVVSVSVNVEARKKVTFNLTYEELMPRNLGAYDLRINLDPGQIVNDLSVEVHINETSDITVLEVPSLQENNEVTDSRENSTNSLARIERPSPTTATVRWAPTKEEQAALRAEGVKGQLLVRYDVDHAASPNQILVSEDGYFVHFFSPPDLPPLPKYIVFVLDVSGSMSGHKIEQLRQAMLSILDELRPEDNFTLVPFSSDSRVWLPDSKAYKCQQFLELQENDAGAIVPATTGNIAKAKEFVKTLEAGGGTAMHEALDKALRVSKASSSPPGAPMLFVLLTDGLPNGSPKAIEQDFTAENIERGITLFTLAFGEDADFNFLKRLALLNGGFGRRIYEAADAHLQLRNFYRQVASPLLSSVNFTYGDGQVEESSLTRTKFPTLFRGGELVVSGRVRPGVPLVAPLVVGEGISHTSSAAQVGNASSGERLWAFLTVRQLLDRDAAMPNQTLKDAAKDIALKYSFVTPVTSLVVVKPNDTSAVDPERAGSDKTKYDSGLSFASLGGPPPIPLGASAGGFGAGFSGAARPAAPIGLGGSGGSFAAGSPGLPGAAPPQAAGGFVQSDLLVPPASTTFASTPLLGFPGGSPGYTGAPPPLIANGFVQSQPLDQRLNISDISWLECVSEGSQVTLKVNGTQQTYGLALNQTETQLDACTDRWGSPGHCRHLANCVVRYFTDNFENFMASFCVVDGSYVGTCCTVGE